MDKEKKTVNDEKEKNVVKKVKKAINKKPAKKEVEKKSVKEHKIVKNDDVEKEVKTVKKEEFHIKHEAPKEEHIHVKSEETHHQARNEEKKEIRTRVNKEKESNTMFIIYLVLILLIILFIVLIVMSGTKSKEKYKSIVTEDNDLAVNGEIITSVEEFNSKFGTKELKESDFEEKNYAVLIVSYDNCSQKNFELEKYEKVGNQLRAYFTQEKKCKECTSKFRYYFLPVGKDVTEELNISVDYQTKNNPKCED